MDERQFVARRQEGWNRLAAILDRAGGAGGLRRLSRDEVRELGPLYRRAASDLAYARAHAVSPGLTAHLNQLAARANALLYRTDTTSWSGMGRFLRTDLPSTFRRRLPYFLASVAVLLLGYFTAYALVIHSKDNVDIFVPPGSFLRPSLDIWATGDVAKRITDAQAAEGASFLMQNNIRVSFIVFALGILGGIPAALMMFVNGAMMGAFSGFVAHTGHLAEFWPGILPHGVVEISETCLAGAAGMSIGWALIAPGPYRRRDALVLAARDTVTLIIGGVLMLVFAGLVEAFISHSLIPNPVKVGFGISSGIALYGYLFLAGRGGRPERAST